MMKIKTMHPFVRHSFALTKCVIYKVHTWCCNYGISILLIHESSTIQLKETKFMNN